jgi:hypothetical protein
VRTLGGTSVASDAAQFTYWTPLTVRSVTPRAGAADGGIAVSVVGTGFETGDTVLFGDAAATNVFLASDQELRIANPPGSGTVAVTVRSPDGRVSPPAPEAQFTYAATSGMQITEVTPDSGDSSGSYLVALLGRGFTGATAVLFGDAAADQMLVQDDTKIVVVPPPGSGTVDVVVVTPDGRSTVTDLTRFTYTDPPQ